MNEQLTIGELASRTGAATSALRYWEKLGLLPAPARVSGQRRYPPSSVKLVGVVLALRNVGFTLREVVTASGARHQIRGGGIYRLSSGCSSSESILPSVSSRFRR